MTINRSLLREQIIKLLEEDTKFSEGDTITTSEGDKGVVTLSKHPFYAVKLNDTGTTHSYHFQNLIKDETSEPEGDFGKYDVEPKEEEQPEQELQEIKVNNPTQLQKGKKYWVKTDIDADYRYLELINIGNNGLEFWNEKKTARYNIPQTNLKNNNLQESAPSEIIKLDGQISVYEDYNVGDVLSDVRSIPGITVVRVIDIPNETHKSKLSIKIDPYPFQGNDEASIKNRIKILIRKVPGCKEFWTNVNPLHEKKFRIKEIRVNNPTNPLPFKEFQQAMRNKANTLINGWDKIIVLTQKYGYDLKDDTISKFYDRLTPIQKIKFIGELDKL